MLDFVPQRARPNFAGVRGIQGYLLGKPSWVASICDRSSSTAILAGAARRAACGELQRNVCGEELPAFADPNLHRGALIRDERKPPLPALRREGTPPLRYGVRNASAALTA